MRAQWAPLDELDHPLGDVPWDGYEAHRSARDAQHDKAALAAAPLDITLAEWDGEVAPRRLRVRDRDLVLEMFGTASPSKRLYVLLSAGGGPLKDGVTPQFPRVSWHPWLDGVCLNIDDPTFAAFPGKLQTGWYFGRSGQDAVASVAAVIGKVRARYGIDAADVTIIGSSAGGTAALKIAGAVDGSLAVVENPPMYPHESTSIKYLRRVGLDIGDRLYRRRNDLAHIIGHPTSRFVILQNTADTKFVEQLTRHLAAAGLPAPRMGLNETGSLTLYLGSAPTLSPHHAFLTVQELLSVLRVVERATPTAMRGAVLDAVYEGLRGRALAADRVSNIQGWVSVVGDLDVAHLADHPRPTDSDTLRIRLRSNPAVVYRLRMGHKAKNVFIALDVKPEHSGASKRELERIAESAGARLAQGKTGWRLSIAHVPLRDAAERMKTFMEHTVVLFE